jgi:hypothetical protein
MDNAGVSQTLVPQTDRTTFVKFGPDAQLPNTPDGWPVLDCIKNKKSSPECDSIIGSAAIGSGFCSKSPWDRMTYCACVNNALPCPHITTTTCSNSNSAYVPTQLTENGREYNTCKDRDICVNVATVEGQNDVISDLVQDCGPVTNVTNVLASTPIIGVLMIFILLLLVSILISNIHTRRKKKKGQQDKVVTSSNLENN